MLDIHNYFVYNVAKRELKGAYGSITNRLPFGDHKYFTREQNEILKGN